MKKKRIFYDRDMENALEFQYKRGYKVGFLEGFREGLKMRLHSIAQNMKNKGFSAQDIIEVTGLTESEINQIF